MPKFMPGDVIRNKYSGMTGVVVTTGNAYGPLSLPGYVLRLGGDPTKNTRTQDLTWLFEAEAELVQRSCDRARTTIEEE